MGGYGSGREGRRPVEDQSLELRFDPALHRALADIRMCGGVVARTVTWSRCERQIAQIGLYLFPDQLVLAYTANGEERRQAFPIVYTPTPYGARPWWQCTCGRRCLRLYNPHVYSWRCRRCWNVTYRSSCESDKRLTNAFYGGPSSSVGALIVALKRIARDRAEMERYRAAALRRARKGTKGGRPRKR